MKYLTMIAALLLYCTGAFADLTDAEKRQALESARDKMEMARAEFEAARKEFKLDIAVELEMAREAMDMAAEALAEIHVQSLDGHENF